MLSTSHDPLVTEALRESKENYRFLRETIPMQIWTSRPATDPGGNVTFFNPVSASLIGLAPAEATGQALDVLFSIIDEETRLAVDGPVRQISRAGVAVGMTPSVSKPVEPQASVRLLNDVAKRKSP